jgi:AbrB family looped-hinge helix DNA binding protein
MSHGNRATIDRAGRLVIPKEIRDRAGLAAGIPLEIVYRDGHVEIEPAPLEVRIERRGRVSVAVPMRPVPALTAAEVEQTRAEVRSRRKSE